MSSLFHAKFLAHELTLRYVSSEMDKPIPTLMGAEVDLNSYQIDATVLAFRLSLSKGVMLADEVRLGKAIKVGISRLFWTGRIKTM